MTSMEVLNRIATYMSDDEIVVAWCEKEKDKIVRKNEYAKTHPASKSTKKLAENAELNEKVYEALASVGEPITVSNLCKTVLTEYNYPKITPRLRDLKDEGRVVSKVEGKNTLYSIA